MATTQAVAARAAARLTKLPTPLASPTLKSLDRRAALAKRQLERRRTRAQAAQQKKDLNEVRGLQQMIYREARALRYAERRARREDWELGALAPNRFAVVAPGRGNLPGAPYGTLSPTQSRGPEVPKHLRKKGGLGIVPGDRVVVVQPGHRDYGRISKVASVSEEREAVGLEQLNQGLVHLEDWQLQSEQDKTPFRRIPLELPLTDVRLVAPLIDPDTSIAGDAVIEALRLQPARIKRGVRLPARRFVDTPDGPIEIPYPPEPANKPEFDGDTLRIEVEERSWTPTLSVPPMPAGVIDELRNKFSAYRVRHDAAWVAARDAEHARAAARTARMDARMVAPLAERALREKAKAVAEGPPALDDEALARIGEVMARNLKIEDVAAAPQAEARAERAA